MVTRSLLEKHEIVIFTLRVTFDQNQNFVHQIQSLLHKLQLVLE